MPTLLNNDNDNDNDNELYLNTKQVNRQSVYLSNKFPFFLNRLDF